MNVSEHARSAYASAAAPIRTDRGTEYAIFSKMTHALSALDESDKRAFPKLAKAVTDNQRLWSDSRPRISCRTTTSCPTRCARS